VPPSYRDRRLPSGRHGLSAEEVAANHQWRLIGAAGEVFAKRGVAGTTSRAIARSAGVSSSTFYGRFESVDDVLSASFAAAAGSLREVVTIACDQESVPETRVAAAVEAAISFAVAEAALAALAGLELAVAVPGVAHGREGLVGKLGELLALARGTIETGVGTHLVAAALALVHDRLGADGARDSGVLGAELTALLT
jgi:AcrR family transcriptional regulator